jgi:undecaprenyl-diphosphatase
LIIVPPAVTDTTQTSSLRAALAPFSWTASNLLGFLRVIVRAPRLRVRRGDPTLAVVAVLLLAVVIGSMYLFDAATSAWASHLPNSIVEAFDEITNFGLGGWFLYPLGSFLIVIAAVMAPALPPLTRGVLGALAARAGFLFIAIGLPGLFVTIVKRMIGRARPYVGGHDDPFNYEPFIWRPEYASMPSGHSTTSVAAAIAIGALWPQARPVVWLYAVIIMLSRVMINVHHPSDVLAGALVGAVGALMIRRWFAARRLVFAAADLKPYPGPSWRRIAAVARGIARI